MALSASHPRLFSNAFLKKISALPTHPWRYVHRDERADQFTPKSPTSSTRATRMLKRAISGRGMQRSSRISQQGNGHGARNQVAVSKAKEPWSSHDFWAQCQLNDDTNAVRP